MHMRMIPDNLMFFYGAFASITCDTDVGIFYCCKWIKLNYMRQNINSLCY